jgi:hypothetical protein
LPRRHRVKRSDGGAQSGQDHLTVWLQTARAG